MRWPRGSGLAPHRLGERGIRLEHHLRRTGAGGLHPAGEGEARAPHVGDPQRPARREGVDAQGEVLHVLEVEASRVVEVDRRLRLPVEHDGDERPIALELRLAHSRRLRVGSGSPATPTMPVCHLVDAPTPTKGAPP